MLTFKKYQVHLNENLIKQGADEFKNNKATIKNLVKGYKGKIPPDAKEAIQAYTDHDDTSKGVNTGIRSGNTNNPFPEGSIAHHITSAIHNVPRLPNGTTLWYGTQSDPKTKHPNSDSFTPNRLVSASLNPKTGQAFATETSGSGGGSYLLTKHSKVSLRKLTPEQLNSGEHTIEVSGEKAKHIQDYDMGEKTPENYSKLRKSVPELQDHHFFPGMNENIHITDSKHIIPIAHIVKLNVHGDQPGISVDHLSTNPGENEVILPHNSIFKQSAPSEFSHIGRDWDGEPSAVIVHHYNYTGVSNANI